MTSTDAIASDADDQVDPHSSANCTIDLVSSSMKPAPRKKKCHDHGVGGPRRVCRTEALPIARRATLSGSPPIAGEPERLALRQSLRASHTASADTVRTRAS